MLHIIKYCQELQIGLPIYSFFVYDTGQENRT